MPSPSSGSVSLTQRCPGTGALLFWLITEVAKVEKGEARLRMKRLRATGKPVSAAHSVIGEFPTNRLGSPVPFGKNDSMKQTWTSVMLAFLLPLGAQGEPTKFVSAEHKIAATIPDGWKQLATTQNDTALKISRSGVGDTTARISVMTYPVSAGVFPPKFDVWIMTDNDIQKTGESGSVDGEAVKVLKFGRAEIDHHHMIWTLNRRTLQENTTMWQLAYEGIRGTDGITVQLTVTGDEEWYAANESVFALFIKVLRLSVPQGSG